MRYGTLPIVLGLLIAGPSLAADEGIPAERLAELKAATVYVKVAGQDGTATGSGFLVARDGESGYIVTNHHVVSAAGSRADPAKLSLVFWSGTKKELVLPAELVTSDPAADLAVLKTSAKNLPAVLDPSLPAQPRETMTVYTLGFPLGDKLSPTRSHPNVTIGKGTVSSLREDERGKLASVQLDSELNPGNSGGPVVDGEGKLVGVAVSKVVGTKIGFAIPAAELKQLLQGRTAGVLIQSIKVENGVAECDLEVPCLDPFRKIKAIQVHWSRKDALKDAPAAADDGTWALLSGAEKCDLKVEGGVGKGKVTLKCPDKVPVEYLFQTSYDNGGAKPTATQPQVRAIDFRATGVVRATDSRKGLGHLWEVVTSKEGGFTIEMPAKPTIQTTRSRRLGQSGTIKMVLVGCESDDGLYLAQKIEFPTVVGRGEEERLHNAVRDAMAEEWNGKVTSEKKVRAEGKSGRDFTIQGKPADAAGTITARVRQYFAGKSIFVIMVVSAPNQELPVDAGKFLGSLALGERRTRVAGTPEPEPQGTELAGWGLAIDSDKDCKFTPGDKVLSIEVPGTLHDLNPDSGKLNTPRVMREMEGDFTAIVKVAGDFRPAGKSTNPKGVPYNGAGLVIWSDSDNFIRLERAAMLRGAKVNTYVAFEEREGGYRGASHNEPFEEGTCWLRLARKGSRIGGAVSTDGKAWKDLKPIDTVWPAKLRVGLTAINSSSEAFSVRFEEFELKAGASDLTTDARGSGAGSGTSPRKSTAKILGGGFDPEFTDTAAQGGLLVGFEIGLGKFFDNDVVKAVRPIYREGDKDSLGKQYGTETSRLVKVVAKPGYAVGAITAKAGLTVDGMSITFMKIIDKDKLDTKDSYESEWIGGKGGGPAVRLGGEGTPVIGIQGKSNKKDMTGLGLQFLPPRP